jgi:hypothetical protein
VSCKSFHLYDVEFDLWSVGLPSIAMRGDRGEVRCCGLSNACNGGDGWNLVTLLAMKSLLMGIGCLPLQGV